MYSTFIDILRKIKPSGPSGLEGLIAELLESLTGRHFSLASSGSQEGRDMSSRRMYANVIAIECKRFGKNGRLDERALLGELDQAARETPDLDIWVLVASCDVPAQIQDSLHESAAQKGIEFFAISSEDGSPSSLEILCAHSPDTVRKNQSIQKSADAEKVMDLLGQVSNAANFRNKINELKDLFSSCLIGYENWRIDQNRCFRNSLRSENETRALFNQPINVEDASVKLIKRESSWLAMDQWLNNWSEKHNLLVVLGEEGDGKTWSVASWLSEKIGDDHKFPGVIFISSTGLDIQDPDLFISKAISHRLRLSPEEQVRRHLYRWMAKPSEGAPLILLVLDGINERRDPTWWRNLLERINGEPWFGHVAIAITCRTFYFHHHGFDHLSYLNISSYEIGPYDSKEFNIALAHHNLQYEDISPDLMPLIIKPRYFDLMIKLRNQVSGSGDITVARLIYEDWRDRYERKSVPIADADFQEYIRVLANRYLINDVPLSEPDIVNGFPFMTDRPRLLEELRTGGILQLYNGRYVVNEQLLIFGFGLLLADQLRQTIGTNTNTREVISDWLEPHAENDIKAAICEYAVIHALSIKRYPGIAKVALLQSWVERQNRPDTSERDFTAYFPVDPQSYVALAEAIWSDTNENLWAQEMLTSALITWHAAPSVSLILPSAFERWLGYVHISGAPYNRLAKSSAEVVRKEISERIGHDIQLGALSFAQFQLSVIDNDGLLGLSHVAISVISHLPRKAFVHAIAIGCVAEAIMGAPDKYDLFAWTIRSSPHDLWPEINKEVEHLVRDDSIVAKQAAYRLLSFEGSEDAFLLRERILGNIFPESTPFEKHRQDPCTSFFQWSEEDCATCLQREDLSPGWIARKIEDYCIDPGFSVPPRIINQIGSLAEEMDPISIWTHLGQTETEFFYDINEAALAAFNPTALAKYIRSIVNRISNRHGMSLRQLSFRLNKYFLILGPEEKVAIYRTWEKLISLADSWDEPDETAEMMLFGLVLVTANAVDQLSFLLRRPEHAKDLISYKGRFLAVTSWISIEQELINAKTARTLYRILWFISSFPTSIPQKLLRGRIMPLINHEDKDVQAIAIEIVYGSKDRNLLDSVIQSGWHWSPDKSEHESQWVSLILTEFGVHKPIEEIFSRIHPSYLGYAVACRGYKSNETKVFANTIHHLLQAPSKTVPLPADGVPHFAIRAGDSDDVKQINRLSFIEETKLDLARSDNKERWERIKHECNRPEASVISEHNEHQRQLQKIIDDVIEKQNAAGNYSYGRVFYLSGIDKVVEEYPEYIKIWLTAALLNTPEAALMLSKNSSIYYALCRILLKSGEEQGIDLFWKLKNNSEVIHFIDPVSKMDLLDIALFKAPPTFAYKAAWESRLNQSTTDYEIMNIAYLSQYGTGKGWLWSYILENMASKVLIERARSLILLGFFDSQEAFYILQDSFERYSDTWLKALAKKSRKHWNQNSWAKHWYKVFLADRDNEKSLGAFLLFLRCVDTRFWLWRPIAEKEIVGNDIFEHRLAFLRNNLESIYDSIKKNEDGLSSTFLGQKVLDREAWPWRSSH